MPATFSIPTQEVIPGQLITSVLWNDEFQNIYDNFTPSGLDDYSSTDGEMQTQTAPFPGSVISRPTSLAGELERIRYALAGLSGETYWYNAPDKTIAQLDTFDLGHRHTGTTDGLQIQVGGLATDAVETAKIKDANVTLAKLAADSVDASKIAASAVGNSELAAGAVTAAKIGALAVEEAKINSLAVTETKIGNLAVTETKIGNLAVTETKIGNLAVTTGKINNEAVTSAKIGTNAITGGHITNGVVVEAKLSTEVQSKLKDISGLPARYSGDVSITGKGRLRALRAQTSNINVTIVVDGVTIATSFQITTSLFLDMYFTGSAVEPIASALATSGIVYVDIPFKTSLTITKTGGAGTVLSAIDVAS